MPTCGPCGRCPTPSRPAPPTCSSTGRISTVSDPLPHIIEGIPLRARSIQVNIDRPNFAINPTNCNRQSTDAQILGDEGAVASRGSHYQVATCGTLGFGPKLTLRTSGGGIKVRTM